MGHAMRGVRRVILFKSHKNNSATLPCTSATAIAAAGPVWRIVHRPRTATLAPMPTPAQQQHAHTFLFWERLFSPHLSLYPVQHMLYMLQASGLSCC